VAGAASWRPCPGCWAPNRAASWACAICHSWWHPGRLPRPSADHPSEAAAATFHGAAVAAEEATAAARPFHAAGGGGVDVGADADGGGANVDGDVIADAASGAASGAPAAAGRSVSACSPPCPWSCG